MTRVRSWLAGLMMPLALCACAIGPGPETQRLAVPVDSLPVMKSFGAPKIEHPARANADLAHDFLELTFEMESGRAVPVLTRFEGPVTLAVEGKAPASVEPDLARLIARLRTEAGIDIQRVGPGKPVGITVAFLPRKTMQAIVPQAACFVVPRVGTWDEFRRTRHTARVDWTTLAVRDRVTVFIPNDTAPQEIRDCLHEEIAQALGPLNDLYRLQDSIFNDDNFNTVLTGFDMLMLRLTYAPALRSGMTRDQVAAALPALLAAVNPAGQRAPGASPGPTPRVWITTIETALGSGTGSKARRDAARRAVSIAEGQGWSDGRLAFSLFALGRLSLADEATASVQAFARAGEIYRALPGSAVHSAHVDMQLAAFALTAGLPGDALDLTNRNLIAVAEAENAALLATLLMIKSEALDQLGRESEARAVRLDSLGWARYGFGTDDQVRARLSEIAALSPRREGRLQ